MSLRVASDQTCVERERFVKKLKSSPIENFRALLKTITHQDFFSKEK
jgi:hypothetical protein